MSKMAELAYDIEQLYIDGMGPKGIARTLNCPIEIVLEWIESNSLDESEDSAFDPFNTVNS